MRLILSLLFILGIVSLTLAQNKDDETVKGLIRQLADAQTAYDSKTLDQILAADYIEISPVGEFDPRAKVLSFYTPEAKQAAGNVTTSVEIAEPSVRNYGKYAIAIVRLNFTMTVEGKQMPPRSMRATFVVRQEGKTWKIVSAQYTGIRPPQPPKPQ